MIGTGDCGNLLVGYVIAAGLTVAAALVELIIGVRAERRVPAWPEGLREERSRRYGEATLWYATRC